MRFWRSSSPARELLGDSRHQRWSEELLVVLMADDDQDHYVLVKSAFEASTNKVDLRWVSDGEEAMDYLLRRGKYAVQEFSPTPDLILLGLIMPRKDGLETLKEIKGDKRLRKIPVVVLATSRKQEHKASGRSLGADSFLLKPHDFDEMVHIINGLHEHYFGILRLPDREMGPAPVLCGFPYPEREQVSRNQIRHVRMALEPISFDQPEF